MKPYTQKDYDQDIADLVATGKTHEEAVDLLAPLVNEINAANSGLSTGAKQVMGVETKPEAAGAGLGNAAMMIIPAATGSIASGLGARAAASPELATAAEGIGNKVLRFLAGQGLRFAQPVAEGTGTAIGDAIARKATGLPQDPKASLGVGGMAGALGSLYRGGTRLAGAVGDVPTLAIDEAGVPKGGILPNVGSVMRPGPNTAGEALAGISAESRLQARAGKAVRQLEHTVTDQRNTKLKYLAEAEARGERVDPEPIFVMLEHEIPTIKAGPGTKEYVRELNDFKDELNAEAVKRGGTFSPLEWDEFIRKSLAPKAYSAATGNPSASRLGPILRKVKNAAADELRAVLPDNTKALDKQITEHLDKADEAAYLFGEDSPGVVNRLRNIRRPGNEDALRSLNFLSEQTDKGLAGAVNKTATRREFSVDLREAPSARISTPGISSALGERAARVMAPFQPFVGPTLASTPYGRSVADSGRKSADELLAGIRQLVGGVTP